MKVKDIVFLFVGLNFLKIYFMCVSVSFAYMCVHHLYA